MVPSAVEFDEPANDATADWAINDGQLLGDPSGAAEHWFQQAANGYCVPASVTQIVAAYTGAEIMDESEFVARANELHLFTFGPDGVPSMDAAGAATLLNDVGIDAHVKQDLTVLDLENFLDAGRPIMLAVDADEMWYQEPDSVDEAANHAVVLTGIDPVNGIAIISDPGSPTGNEYTMSLAELDAIWEDSGRQAVVVDQPADQHGAVTDGEAAARVEVGVASWTPAEGGIADILSEPASPLDGVVRFIGQHPVVLLPVVVAAGVLVRGARRH